MVGSYSSSSSSSIPAIEASSLLFSASSSRIFPSLISLNFCGGLIPSFLDRTLTLSITYWAIGIGIALQRDIIFLVDKCITSNPPCNVSNDHRYMIPNVMSIVLFVGLISCISWPYLPNIILKYFYNPLFYLLKWILGCISLRLRLLVETY